MAVYQVENQWGGESAPWNEGGMWVLGSRADQNIVAIDIKSLNGGETLNGTITYNEEGTIGFRAKRSDSNDYIVENQWGGESAPWNEAGIWVLDGRADQNIVAINVKSLDDGKILYGTVTYNGEGSIGFKGVRVEVPMDANTKSLDIKEPNQQSNDDFWLGIPI